MTARPSEFELIDAFCRPFRRLAMAGPAVHLGVGDDAALLALPGCTAATTDAIVEGVHFTGRFRSEDIGHKALAVNLSDLAAMGAEPAAFLCALALPPRWLPRMPRVALGMARLAAAHRCPLVGGNVTSARAFSLTITALGRVRRPLLRSGARPGDRLLVSGALGGAAAGLRPQGSPALRLRQARPTPRVELGLAAARWCHAAIDVSDGLLQDLGHLLAASGVGAEIIAKEIPLQRGATLGDALRGGEDYELLLAAPRSAVSRLAREAERLGVDLSEIGAFTARRGLRLEGHPVAAGGFDHLARR